MSHSESSLVHDSEDRAVASYEDELERMIGDNLHQGQDLHTQKLFLVFQNAATEVTKMFRGTSTSPALLFLIASLVQNERMEQRIGLPFTRQLNQ